jgi:hypothetical protein
MRVIENGLLKTHEDYSRWWFSLGSDSFNIAVGDGVMLVAGYWGATVYEGKQWHEFWKTPSCRFGSCALQSR